MLFPKLESGHLIGTNKKGKVIILNGTEGLSYYDYPV